MISLKQFYSSWKHAMHGLRVVYRDEQNLRIQIGIGAVVIGLALWLRVATYELIILLLLIGSVLVLELINSVFERMADTFKPRIHPVVKDVKDIMAATVLLTALFATIVGIIILLPKIV